MDDDQGMIANALEKFRDLIIGQIDTGDPIYENSKVKVFLASGPDGFKVHTQKLTTFERSHNFVTLEGFADYLNSTHAKDDNGIIFVGPDRVFADLIYGLGDDERKSVETHTLNLALGESEEFKALRRFFSPINQRDLWKLLITKLDGCIDPKLLLAIGSIRVAAAQEAKAEIDFSGLSSGAKSASVKVNFTTKEGSQASGPIRVDWTFTGRIWESFANPYVIPLRLELEETDKGIVFTFHPRSLESVLRQARADLVAEISSKVPADRFTVHEGTY